MAYARSGDAAHREPGWMRVLLLAAADREGQTDGDRHLREVDAAAAEVGLVREIAPLDVQVRRAHRELQAQATTEPPGTLRLALTGHRDLRVVVTETADDVRSDVALGLERVHQIQHTAEHLGVAINTGIMARLFIRTFDPKTHRRRAEAEAGPEVTAEAHLIAGAPITHGVYDACADVEPGLCGCRRRDCDEARRGEHCHANALHFQPPSRKKVDHPRGEVAIQGLKKPRTTVGNGVAEVNSVAQLMAGQKSRVCRSGTPSYDSDHVSCDLQEPGCHLDSLVSARSADSYNSLPQQGHEGGVTWENPYEPVVGGRHDRVGLPLEHRPLGRDEGHPHQDDAIFLAWATTSSIPPCM